MPFVELGKERLFYTLSGPGGTRVLLLIHGSGGSHRHWPEELRGLNGADVYAIDLPGHGRSTGKSRSSVEEYADVIDAFVSNLGRVGVTLIGHSLGGAVAQMLALRSPGWLARIVLVGTGCRLRVMPAILDGLTADYAGTIGLVGDMAVGPDASSALKETLKGIFLDTPPKVTHDDFSACNAFDVTDELGGIHFPTLVISGSEDKLTPVKYGEYLHRHIPNAQMVVIDRGGHMMALEKPGEVVECIEKFIR